MPQDTADEIHPDQDSDAMQSAGREVSDQLSPPTRPRVDQDVELHDDPSRLAEEG